LWCINCLDSCPSADVEAEAIAAAYKFVAVNLIASTRSYIPTSVFSAVASSVQP
jgi:hypothetical protein